MMPITEAIKMVMELARQGIIDERDLPEEHLRQTEACDTVEDYFFQKGIDVFAS